jgi:acyl-coenzyme A synthetase/AMP-(fatty) acid ligase/uncharacterized membrane protein
MRFLQPLFVGIGLFLPAALSYLLAGSAYPPPLQWALVLVCFGFGFWYGFTGKSTWGRAGGVVYLVIAVSALVSLIGRSPFALYLPAIFLNVALGITFAKTLQAGETPLVERVMRLQFPQGVPPVLVGFARRLTVLWVAFFALMALATLAVALTLTSELALLVCSVLNYALLFVFFVAQLMYGHWRYRAHTIKELRLLLKRLAPGADYSSLWGPGKSPALKYPLLAYASVDRPLAYGREGLVCVEQFLAEVAALAATLPARAYVINDCADRYRFLVGFAAALTQNQVSLLPNNRTEHAWRQLVQDYPDVYCLTDQTDAPSVLPTVAFPTAGWVAAMPASQTVPAFLRDQTAAIVFTSGSSGRPKPCVKTWGALVLEARQVGESLGLVAGQNHTIVATVPAQHMYGFVVSVVMPLQHGFILCRDRPFFPEDIRGALDASPALPVLALTPVHLRACVVDKTPLPAVAFILSSAAPLPRAVAEEAQVLFNTRVLEFYGSTETGAIAWRRQTESDAWHAFSAVRVKPHPRGFEVNADYFSEPVVLTDVVDVVSAHEFRLMGRDSDIVKIGGKRNSLLALNQQLQEVPGVRDAVFLLEEGTQGREPRLNAFVVAPTLTRAAVLSALRERVDEVFVPRKLWLVPYLPRNATGKLPREQLLKLLDEQLAKDGTNG